MLQWQAYWQLARLDKPIGSLLLLWPTLWSLWLAAGGWPGWQLLVVFVAGVWLMRSAGCVINDYADRHVDGHVKRTAARPLPAGRLGGRQALAFLRHSEGGRYQVRTSSESVYFNAGSRMRSGKAYHKGPHLAYQMKKRQAEFTALELSLAERLLRLELSLRSQWWHREKQDWYDFNETQLDRIHADYFDQFIGKVEVVEMDNLLESLEKVSKSKGRALGAYRTWSLVKSIGVREAQASMSERTWRSHKKMLFDAGLTWADLQMSNVVPLRRRPILLGSPVRSWDELIAKVA